MALTLIVTNAGRAALVNAANTGTAPVTIAQVGLTATAVTPLATAVALPGEFKRLATLSGDVVDDDTIHVIVRDESADVFTVRSLALYLADGTLFGIYGQATVLIEKSAQAMMLLGIDVRFEDIDATSITFGDANFLNPPATTEQIGVVELATLAETLAGIDTSRVPAAKMVKDAVFSWLDTRFGASNAGIWHPGNDGAGSGLDADLLDGQQGSYYSNIPARLGFTPVQQGTGNGQLTATSVKVGWSGTRLKATVDVTDLGNVVFDGHIADVWRASNDGAGSGLDADLLDGLQASVFARRDGVHVGPVNIRVDDADFIISDGTDPVTHYLWRDWDIDTLYIGTAFAQPKTRYDLYTEGGSKYWHASNDGAGSGMDADLLDGQQGSYYRDLGNSTGTLPNARVSGTYDGLTEIGSMRARLLSTASNSTLDVTSQPYQAGLTTSFNISGDAFGFQARNDGAASYLSLNPRGGLVLINGFTAFHPGNDGAGSGMDADLLDGQEGTYYRDLGNSTGTLPAARLSGSYSGLTELGSSRIRLTSTASNSSLDVTSHPYQAGLTTGLNVAGDAFGFQARNNGAASYLALNPRGGLVLINGSTTYHAGNDGSGSGLDADLLDGFEAADFLRAIGISMAMQGYMRLSNGLILQWGSAAGTYSANVNIQVNFPITFPNEILHISGSNADVEAQGNAVVGINYTTPPNASRFFFRTNVAGQNRCNWIAIGR